MTRPDPTAEPDPPPPSTEGGGAPPDRGRARRDLAAALACAGLGLILAVAPHLAVLARYGTAEYVADGDDVLYLAVSRIPYYGEPALRDPFRGRREAIPTLYAWLQFVPPAVLTRGLGLGPLTTALVWRAVGGPLLGLGLYYLFRRLLAATRHPTAWALGCSLVCLADAGFVGGQTLFGSLALVRALRDGTTTMPSPKALGQYRVVTPLLNLPALLALVGLMTPSARRRTAAGAAAGAVALGLCVHLYFFFWTAAVLGVGLYLAGRAAATALGRDPTGRGPSELAFGAAVLAGGLAVGAPQVYANARAFSDPAVKPVLQRLCRGQSLPPGHPARTRLLKNTWALGKLAAGAALIVALGAWRLTPVWAFTAAGYLLANSAVVTGLDFENFHWAYVHCPLGEVLVLAGGALLLDRLPARPWSRAGGAALWALPAALVVLALVWRPYEALRAPESAACNRALRDLGAIRPALARLGPDDILAGPWEANLALLPGSAGQLYQFNQTAHTSVIPDAEVNERHALNGWLEGLGLDEYLREAGRYKICNGEPTDPGWTAPGLTEARGAVFRALLDGREADRLLARYHPDALLRPSASGPPPRGGPWAPAAVGDAWALWVRPAGGAGPGPGGGHDPAR